MIFIDEIKDMYLYKKPTLLPRTEESRHKGSMIIMNTPNLESSINLINNRRLINRNTYRSYYIDRMYLEKINTRLVRKKKSNNEQTEMYKEIHSKCPMIRKTFIKKDRYKDFNLFFDIHIYNQIYFETNKLVGMRLVDSYMTYLSRILKEKTSVGNYDKKLMIIPVHDWVENLKDQSNYIISNVDSPVEAIYHSTVKNIDLVKKLNIDILFFTDKAMFMMRNENLHDKTPTELKMLLKRLSARDDSIEDDSDDISSTDENDVSEQNKEIVNVIVDNIENKINKKRSITGEVEKEVPAAIKKEIKKIVERNSNNSTKEIEDKDTTKKEVPKTTKKEVSKTTKKDVPKTTKKEKVVIPNSINNPKPRSLPTNRVEKNTSVTTIPSTITGSKAKTTTQKKTTSTDRVKLVTKDKDDMKKKIEQVADDIENNEKIIAELEKIKNEKIYAAKTQKNLARNKKLADDQSSIPIGGKTLSDVIEEIVDKTIEPYDTNIEISNEELKVLDSVNFDKGYNDKLLQKDTLTILDCFKDMSLPIYIKDIKIEDTSDTFTLKETWTVHTESANRKRSTLVFDIPKFINDQFMYINGNKKNIIKQLTLKPIVKTREDIVQISSNYNKIFVYRYGQKISPVMERLKKAIIEYDKKKNVNVKYGNNKLANVKYRTTMEYDDLGTTFMSIEIKDTNSVFEIHFNQDNVHELSGFKPDILKADEILIGYDNKKPVILNTEDNKIKGSNLELSEYLIDRFALFYPEFKEFLHSINTGKKFLYTRAKIMEKFVPLIILVSYSEGLTNIMKRADINFYFSDTRPRLTGDDRDNKGIIEFEDSYLVFDRYPFKNSLLMNGLYEVPTKNWIYSEFDNKDVYIEIFDLLYNSRIIANGFDNFYELMIDPITYEVLNDLNLPDNYTGLLLLANELLQDNAHIKENDMSNYRIRSNEMINGYLYKVLSRAYSTHKNTSRNNNPRPFSVPRNEVIKNILESPIIEDYSTLNPVSEVEKIRGVSFKGLSGMNLEHAYTLDKRSYHDSMKGIIAINSPPSGKVGIIKQLSLDPNVTSPRGYLKLAQNNDDLNSANAFAPSELLTPMTAQRDDAPRVAMSSTQSKHIVPTTKSDPVLIRNGMEKILPKVISDDFAFKAKQDGRVVEINEETNLMIVEYKDGINDIIDLNPSIEKNSNGGFFISNQLKARLKENNRFKKDDILAINDKFFTNDKVPVFTMGPLVKIAVLNAYYTYEDSIIVTEKLSGMTATEVIMKRDCPLGKNSNVDFIVKKGQSVEVGDPLIVFERSYEEDDINKLLANIGDELGEDIVNLGKISVKSKHSGIIEDIKIYYTTDLDELSPSLQKLVRSYSREINKIKSTVSKYKDKTNSTMIFPPTEKIETMDGKIKGITVGDGVLIEFYVKYTDKLGVGDKTTAYTALKGIVCDIIPKGQEPYSEFRPDEEISSFLSPISIWSRMTGSILIAGWGNKVLIEMKRKLQDMYNKNEGKS